MLLIPIIPHQVKELRRVEHRATGNCLIFAKRGLQAAMPCLSAAHQRLWYTLSGWTGTTNVVWHVLVPMWRCEQ